MAWAWPPADRKRAGHREGNDRARRRPPGRHARPAQFSRKQGTSTMGGARGQEIWGHTQAWGPGLPRRPIQAGQPPRNAFVTRGSRNTLNTNRTSDDIEDSRGLWPLLPGVVHTPGWFFLLNSPCLPEKTTSVHAGELESAFKHLRDKDSRGKPVAPSWQVLTLLEPRGGYMRTHYTRLFTCIMFQGFI